MNDLTNDLFLTAYGVLPNEHPDWSRQMDLEEEMRSAGIARFRAQLEANREQGRESQSGGARRLLIHAHEKVVKALEAFFEECTSGKAGRRHTAYHYLQGVDLDMLAHITLRSLFDAVSMRKRLTNTASRIASMVEDELYFDAFKEKDKAHYERAKKKIIKQTSNPQHQKRVMIKNASAHQVEWEEWTPDTRIKIGTKLVELVVESTGFFELSRQSEGKNCTNIYVSASEEVVAWLRTEHARQECMSPVYLPTIIPPKPWTSASKGGYWSGRVRHLKLIKTHNKAYLEDLDSRDLSTVMKAVNAMQETAWAINPTVLEVMTNLWTNNSSMDVLPQAEDLPLPVKPDWLTDEMTRETMTEWQQADFGRWKSERAATYEANARAVSKRLQFSRMLWVAERFKDEPEFYFPHQMDFRGRVYAVPLFLNPQGNDAAHGLLQFANSVPIGNQEGADWLAIHGAGLWGVDKVSMQERVDWVNENSAELIASAEDPYANRFWATAEKPWQALAFCLEWAGFMREGYAWESHLPVQMDGTCNGLQNFSAMLLDEIGGRAVNLVPGDKPNDIYQTVADVVIEKLKALSEEEPEDFTEATDEETGEKVRVTSDGAIARQWLAFGITRKDTKRPVMTLAYGASEFGFRQQVFDDTVAPYRMSSGDAFMFEGTGWRAASFLGQLIWDCVGEVVVAARGAMDWLQAAAKVASKEGLPVVWTTPAGLTVMQEYTTGQQKRLDLTFQKVRVQLAIDVSTRTIDKRKQASGISPNWVHSMDAAHMQLTVARCHDEGMRSFSLIHDSYGTHAGNAWVMARYLREEFVRMYSEHDVLAEFREEITAMLPEGRKLPQLPPKGTLDLALVLESPFFFA